MCFVLFYDFFRCGDIVARMVGVRLYPMVVAMSLLPTITRLGATLSLTDIEKPGGVQTSLHSNQFPLMKVQFMLLDADASLWSTCVS